MKYAEYHTVISSLRLLLPTNQWGIIDDALTHLNKLEINYWRGIIDARTANSQADNLILKIMSTVIG